MPTILAIAIGGGLGSVLRHLVNNAVGSAAGTTFPWGIMLINVVGSLIMGVLVSVFAHVGEVPQSTKAFLTVGILGGFTTFSTFSLDSIMLIERGTPGLAALYVGGSVGLGLVGLYSGMVLVRVLTAA